MAVSVDTVYQRVLTIANKEQRGYITPQDFNLLANQAQLDIIEQYFYDLNQYSYALSNNNQYSDMVTILREKIQVFNKQAVVNGVVGVGYDMNTISDLYRLGAIEYNGFLAEEMDVKDSISILQAPLMAPTTERPVYTIRENIVNFSPDNFSASAVCNYIRKPHKVEWGYVVLNDRALYNANTTTDFELHGSDEIELVFKILSLSGLVIEDPSLYQAGSIEDAKNTQQEKQ